MPPFPQTARQRMNSSANRLSWRWLALASLLAPTVPSQAPAPSTPLVGAQLHAAIAESAHRSEVPAIVWLCEDFLPSLPQWPKGLDPAGAFSLSLSAAGLKIRATKIEVPEGAVAFGSCSLSEDGSGPQLMWRCDENGRERWFAPANFTVPDRWQRLLHALEADFLDTPRTLAVPIVIGHLAGGLLDTDPRSSLLRLGPSLCGDATWMAWHQDDSLQVCGRSNGGLMLPLTLLILSIVDGGGELSALSLRAFAARDADQAEAARQLGRTDRDLDTRTLRALLHADDSVRLAAIEALVRHGASHELPAIVHAASDDNPWATIAARDAVLRLWPVASTAERTATSSALQASNCAMLRDLDVAAIATKSTSMESPRSLAFDAPTELEAGQNRARALVMLFLSAVGLLGLWCRERVLLNVPGS